MPNTNEVFGNYDKDQPLFKMDDWETIKSNMLNALFGIIPGSRAVYAEYKNPDISWKEYLDLMAEDLLPFYNSVAKPAAKGEDVDWENAAKEAALLGIPMPYTKFPKGHPKAGATVPKNLKEALPNSSWRATTSGWRTGNNPRKLYFNPADMRTSVYGEDRAARGTAGRRMSTRSQIGATQELRDPLVESTLVGPFNRAGTTSNVVNTQGTNMLNTNRTAYGERNHGRNTGAQSYQGEMYDPRRQPIDYTDYGPYIWDADPYAAKLNNVINEQENKWNFLINETRPDKSGRRPISKEEGMRIAMEQGRPDIAARIAADTDPKIPIAKGPKYTSYYTRVTKDYKGTPNPREKFMDVSNRAVEKELREFIGAYADNPVMFEKIANHYGLRDILEDYKANPQKWLDYQKEVKTRRDNREAVNARHDVLFQRNKK